MQRAREQAKQIGRPKRISDRKRATKLIRGGASLMKVARLLGVGEGTIRRDFAKERRKKASAEKVAAQPGSPGLKTGDLGDRD